MRFTQTSIKQIDNRLPQLTGRDFDLAYWRNQQDSMALAGGRGASQKIQLAGESYVLRHYLRGGLVARVLTDQYVWTGLRNSRPWRENAIVEQALQSGLPVAAVAAYCIQRSGLFYRAAIISRYIDNRGSLAQCLGRAALDSSNWRDLGKLIRRLHQAGIYHDDLNANNILVTANNDFYLIDFDKAKRIPAGSAKGEQNLRRLLRSLQKIAGQQQQQQREFHFSSSHWQSMLDAYEK